jgi:hypothetical protein
MHVESIFTIAILKIFSLDSGNEHFIIFLEYS